MRIFRNLDEIAGIKQAVVTTGSFDGVHIGHKSILARLNKLASLINGESVLITFHPHPRKILFPDTAGKNLFLINSQEEKIRLLQQTGLHNLLIIPFTLEFSQMSSIDFIRKILVAKLNSAKVVVGFNHHFGHNQEGNYDALYQLGKYHHFEVEEIPEQDIENETVSSTRIRGALSEGKIQRANAYLDHYYMIMGLSEPETIQEAANKYKTYHILIEEDCKLIPPEGTYAVTICRENNSSKGLVVITNKAHQGYHQNLGRYVYLIPIEDHTSYDHCHLTLFFHKLIREEATDSRLSFLQQLEKDIFETQELIY